MKRLLNVDEEWLAGIQNCPPQGNLGGGVDEVLDLEAVARRWLGGVACIVMKAESWVSGHSDISQRVTTRHLNKKKLRAAFCLVMACENPVPHAK